MAGDRHQDSDFEVVRAPNVGHAGKFELEEGEIPAGLGVDVGPPKQLTLNYKLCPGNYYHPRQAPANVPGVYLMAQRTVMLKPGSLTEVELGVRLVPPEGHYVQLIPIYHLARRGLEMVPGAIGRGSYAPVKVLLRNTSDVEGQYSTAFIRRGEKLAIASVVRHLQGVKLNETQQLKLT